MEIKKSDVVEKYEITGAKNLDRIFVFTEDFAERQGQITMRCWGTCWTAYWGGIGSRPVKEFFLSCNNGYLADNFVRDSGVERDVLDYDKIIDDIKSEACKRRRDEELDKEKAREFFDNADDIEEGCEIWQHCEALEMAYGDDYAYDLPKRYSTEFNYLMRVIQAVREAFEMEK